jgi:hypothetical protein
MTPPTDIDVATVDELVDTVQSVLEEERERTTEELQAFEAFTDRVANLQPSHSPHRNSVGTGQHGEGPVVAGSSAASQSIDDPAAIRRAYEETVMDVSFYDAEYGDDYEESVRSELGPEIAVAVTQPNCFGTTAKRALLTRIERAKRERERLLETCKRERDSLDDAASTLRSIGEELDTLSEVPLEQQRFGTLDAYRTRTQTLETQCDEVAATRQQIITQQRDRHQFGPDEPDFCNYLYKDIEPTYPILLLCSELARRATEQRKRVERAMSHSS